MDRMPLMGPAKDFYIKVVSGYRDAMERSSILPWDLSSFFIEDLERTLKGPEGLKGDAVVNALVMAAQVDYSDLIEDWDKLSIEERGAVVSRIIEAMAVLGLASLFGSIAVYSNAHDKEKILHIAIRYYKGEISYNEMVSEIEDILWPTQEDKNLGWEYLKSYRKGMSLADALPQKIVRAIVDVYLIKIIELQQFDGTWAVPVFYPNFLE
jgi:hypothetical protein